VSKKIHLNLNQKNSISLNENSYTDFSNDVYFLMQSLYGGRAPELKVTMGGSPSQITSFFAALQKEKRYMDSFIKHGLNDAQSMHSKWQLQDAVDQFEFETGLKWPFIQ